jgi:chemotaxis protein CheX
MSAELVHDSTRQEELAANLVHDVFSTMLGSEAWPDPDGAAGASYPVMGVVFFAGAWKGAVQVELESSLAYQITAHLMAVPPPDRDDSDVRDAIGEVANMIAGNLKSTLPPDTVMSMPAVVAGSDFALTVIGSNQSTRMAFATPNGRFTVTLVQTLRG